MKHFLAMLFIHAETVQYTPADDNYSVDSLFCSYNSIHCYNSSFFATLGLDTKVIQQ